MKAVIKVSLLLAVFIAVKEAAAFFIEKAFVAYETSAGYCGCVRPPAWEISAVRVIDFFTHWPSPVLSDFLWGGIAVAIYLWAEKRRNARRASAHPVAEAKAGIWPPPVKAPPR